MRYPLFLLLLTACCFTACKKDEDDKGDVGQVLQSINLMEDAKGKFLELGQAGSLTAREALMETAAWLEGQNGVSKVYVMDSLYLTLVSESGLKTRMQISPVDGNGFSIFRGGGGGSAFKRFSAGGTCSDKLSNNKVLLFAPVYSEFYAPGELAALAATITNSGNNLEVTMLIDEYCTPDRIKNFANYGLVIMDTHGEAESFCTGATLQFTAKPADEDELKSIIVNTLGQNYLDNILSGDFVLTSIVKVKNQEFNWDIDVRTDYAYNVFVSSKFVKALPQMTNTIIFGNMCYSGYATTDADVKDPIRPAFMSLNPVSYYCYAQPTDASTPVDNDFARDMENKLIQRLVIDQDSTGIAYLKPDNTSEYKAEQLERETSYKNLYFKHFGKDTYCYGCGGVLTDSRDGQTYKTVCIGNQVWMAENLNYNAPGSACYDGNPANCNNYGRLYDWATLMQGAAASITVPSRVKGVCPQGWHVPSEAEWEVMLHNFGADSLAGAAIRDTVGWDAPNTGATNESGFNGKPAGYYNTTAYMGLGTQASWWTTAPYNSDSTYAKYVTTSNMYASIARYSAPKYIYNSCRCVKD